MIEAARRRLPRVQFSKGGIEEWNDPGPIDVILANAVLQWVPDHAGLLPRLVAKLISGGGLAIQMPDNLEDPAHRLMREVAADGPWAGALASASETRTPIADAGWYYEVLRSVCSKVDVWRTTYHHPMREGAAGIVEWFKGSGLRPFLEPLDSVSRAAFLQRYTAAVALAYPALTDGSVLLPFPRLFMTAIR
jgi:trans-aconitate 2-methyltransferase